MLASLSLCAALAAASLTGGARALPRALPPGPAANPSPESEAERALAAARRALERGDAQRAGFHFERAAAGGGSIRVEALLGLAELARAAGDDEGLARAALAWTDEAMGTRGRTEERPPRGAFEPSAADVDLISLAAGVAATRAAAVAELAQAAAQRESKGRRRPEQLLTAAWLRRFALDLAQRSPRVLAAHADVLDPNVHAPKDPEGDVLKALERVAERGFAGSDPGLAARAARIVHGFGVQADFVHLRGARPTGMARWRSKGAEMLARARERLGSGGERPWSVEELEWLASDQGEAFTREHSSFAAPGVALSPRGWYRIESDCGYETLLGVARSIEDHHTRLAAHFGSDPFTDGVEARRQGLIRIVPDPSGLEAEGAPFFWAGGFQSGDTTVIRHSVGTISGLGRGLTHELTHRFDGALHAGIPAWLAEGRAVWTSEAYAFTEDEEFVASWCNFQTMRSVLGRGQASLASLEALLAGEPEDYRQNYSVGLALYVFLRTWHPASGAPLFAEALQSYEDASPRSRGDDPLEAFVEAFCDGGDGRPASLAAFQESFVEFLSGFDRREPAEWASSYTGRHPRAEAGGWVYDEPTWTWDWRRAEPRFGQNQARLAGELLAEQGDDDSALRALVWARAVDGYDRRTASALADVLSRSTGASRAEARWAVRHEQRGAPLPWFLGDARSTPVPARLSAVDVHLASLREAAGELRGAGLARAAARLEIDANRVAAWAGRAGVPLAGDAVESVGLEIGGWVDEELTGLDRDRPQELFGIDEDGGILLGRREGRGGTGRFDRRGGGKAFLRASRWMLPGAYSVRTTVRFTTGFNTVLAVVGWTSRERNIRLSITAGDWEYAVGDVDDEPEFDAVRCRFDGLRTRDRGLVGSEARNAIDLGGSRTAIQLELFIEGAALSAWIDGRYVGTYHTIDGAPIEGYVGFGTSQGAVHVASPIVQRFDGEVWRFGGSERTPAVLDLRRGEGPPFAQLRNRRFLLAREGTPPPVGSLVLWSPERAKSDEIRGADRGDAEDRAVALRRTLRGARSLLERMERAGVVQPLLLALPERFRDVADVEEIEAELASIVTASVDAPRVVFHRVVAPEDEGGGSAADQNRRWLLFLDDTDVVRRVVPWTGSMALEDQGMEHWLRVFRDHGRPERALTAPERLPLEGDSQDGDPDDGDPEDGGPEDGDPETQGAGEDSDR